MVNWLYAKDRRMTKREIKVADGRICPLCDGFLQRVAQRGHVPPYRWVPVGYRCVVCNTFVISSEVGI